jgi:hypothetical protein
MKIFKPVLFCAALLLASPLAAQNAGAAAAYDSLLARFQAGDTTVATALRMAYAATPAYDPYGTDTSGWEREMFTAFGRKDFPKVREMAELILKHLYVDPDGHMGMAIALREMGDSAGADLHFRLASALIGSIGEGGGRTPDSPMRVIAVSEEYSFLRASGLTRKGQSLSECRGSPCDAMEVTDPKTGETLTLYFDVSLPMNHMTALMNGGGKGGKPKN